MVDTGETAAQKEKTAEEMKELYENSMRSLQDGNILQGKIININVVTLFPFFQSLLRFYFLAF